MSEFLLGEPEPMPTAPAKPAVFDAPTVTVRPAAESKPAKPAKLDFDDLVQRGIALGYSPNGAAGVAQNVMRESGGNPLDTGGNGTSHGLFQHHNERWDQLQAFAKKQGMDPNSPDAQFAFADKELREQYPTLRNRLTDDKIPVTEAEDSFKRVFERPASVMWQGKPGGGPRLGNDKYSFSEYALREHARDDGTDVVYMPPQDYLDLTPPLGKDAFQTPAGRSIAKSVARGDKVEEIPSLGLKVDGQTAQVTEQDGRHRALLAQQNGVDMIPVAVRKEGNGTPTEIVGTTGKVLPHKFTPAAQMQTQPGEGGSLMGRIASAVGNALVPSAAAAEVPPGSAFIMGEPEPMPTGPATPPTPAAPSGITEAQPEDIGQTSAAGVAGSFGRGLAPYAAAGGIGGALGGPPGALAGLALAGATDLGTTAYNAVAPHVGLPPSATLGTLTDMALDHLGLPRPQTATERTAEAAGAGVGNALSGSAAAKALAETAVNPLVKAVAGSLAEKPATQMAAGGLSAAASTIAKESGASPAVQFTAGALASVLPFAGPRMLYNAIKINPSQAAKDAIGAGYILPPAEATEGSIAKVSPVNVMAGAGGKIKMEQFASAKNQAVTDGISARELGFPEKTLMDSTMLQHYRDMQGLPYGRLKSIQRPFQVDQQFQDDISALAREARIAGSEYSQMKSPELEAMLKDLTAKGEYSPTAMIERIKALRQDSVSNLSSPAGKQVAYKDLSLGTAQRGAAMAMEDLIERNLAKTNQVHLLDDVRTARVNIAKSYDIETALNDATHQVSARRLAALQNRGKPLAGGLKTIADAANNFERSFQTPTKFGAVESLSVLDVSFAGMAAARSFIHGDVTQGLEFMAAAGIRPLARATVMNKSFQQKMVGIVKPSLAQPSGALSPFVLYPGLQMLMGNKGDQQ
jgi:hypothetical protein